MPGISSACIRPNNPLSNLPLKGGDVKSNRMTFYYRRDYIEKKTRLSSIAVPVVERSRDNLFPSTKPQVFPLDTLKMIINP